MRGTLRTSTSSSVRTQAARAGSAAFLFPAGVNVPESGTPPSMTSFSMGFARARRPRIEPPPRLPARVTAMLDREFAARSPGTCTGGASDRRVGWCAAFVCGGLGTCTFAGRTPCEAQSNGQISSKSAISVAGPRGRSGSVKPHPHPDNRGARMFEPFRPKAAVSYEHVFCSTRTSTLAQRAHRALSLTRAFLLLEDGDPVDWEVDQEELAATSNEPTWAHAHRWPNGGFSPKASVSPLRSLCRRRAPRRGGQPAPPPQPCLCPTQPSGSCARPVAGHRKVDVVRSAQRGSRITTGSSRVAIDR